MRQEETKEIDYTTFDPDTLQVLEAYAVEDLKFYSNFQSKLEELAAKSEQLKPLLPHNLNCAKQCEIRLEMIRKALSTVH